MKARDNPFRAARVLRLIRYTGLAGGVDALLPRLATLRYRAAIVGPHGSGKTTLLEDLEADLSHRGFRIVPVRLDSTDRRLPRGWTSQAAFLSAEHVVCLDGAEQLGTLDWLRMRWVTRRAGGLIVTSHCRGRLPTLITCAPTPALLDGIIRRLAPRAIDGAPSAADLFVRHRGNLRDALRELYDIWAAAP